MAPASISAWACLPVFLHIIQLELQREDDKTLRLTPHLSILGAALRRAIEYSIGFDETNAGRQANGKEDELHSWFDLAATIVKPKAAPSEKAWAQNSLLSCLEILGTPYVQLGLFLP